MIPTYLGRRVAKIKISNVPPEIEEKWLVSAMCLDIEEEVNILEVTAVYHENWIGQEIQLLVQVDPANYEKIPHRIQLTKDSSFHVAVEGRRPSCYVCSSKTHLQSTCPVAQEQRQQHQQQDEERQQQQPQENQNKRKKPALLPTPPYAQLVKQLYKEMQKRQQASRTKQHHHQYHQDQNQHHHQQQQQPHKKKGTQQRLTPHPQKPKHHIPTVTKQHQQQNQHTQK
uniref:Uncharacterized protein n=1 Tax=Octopus bimaculoides TaxID=37653 RepID=A0A0L8H9F3_OCTBM